jgi:KDO2-lipid IV(A) lauroyltransferase
MREEETRADAGPAGSAGSFRHVLSSPSFYRFGVAAARWIPRRALYRVADVVGLATYASGAAPARHLRANLRRIFPDASEGETRALARRIFRNFARYLVDYGIFGSTPAEGFDRAFGVLEGRENLEGLFDAGRGVILVTGHIGNWELGGLFWGQSGIKLNVVTLPEGDARIDRFREAYRHRYRIDTIVVDGTPFATLEMMAALRRGEMVAMLVDRWGKADGVAAPFFGGVHYLPRGPFALSRATGAPILPAFVVREGAAYRGIVDRPFVAEGRDDAVCAARISEALERVVRRYPDQWYNFVPIGDKEPQCGRSSP